MWLLSNARRAVRKEQDLWEYSPLPLLDSMIAAPTPRAPKPTDRCAGEYLALSIKSEHPFVFGANPPISQVHGVLEFLPPHPLGRV
jgi:hypothetical protein